MRKKLLTYGVSLCLLAGATALPIAQVFGDSLTASAGAVQAGATFSAQDSFKVNKTFSPMPLTVEATVTLSSSLSGRGGVILGNYGGTTQCLNFEVSNGGVPRLYYNSGSTLTDLKFSQVSIAKNEAVHVAYVMDFENSQAKFFLDGELKQTLGLTNTQVETLSSKMMIGGDLRSGNDVFFKGTMYDLTVYSDVRTDAEIAEDAIPNSQRGDNLLAHYDFVGEIGNTLSDQSGNGYDARRNITWIDSNEVGDYSYAFAVVGDTQIVNSKDAKNYPLIYQWIADNAKAKKIKYVMGLGDITDKDTEGEWERAIESFQSLDGIVPHSQVRGNHDYQAQFEQYMNYDAYKESRDGMLYSIADTYKKISIGKVKYLIMTLNYGASDEVLDWANEVIAENPDHNVIIATHAYMNYDGGLLDRSHRYSPTTEGCSSNGVEFWDKLISKHANICLVLCGHIDSPDVVVRQDKGVHGNTVTSMLIDPQGLSVPLGGGGLSAILHFSKDGKDVQVEYFSPINEMVHGNANKFSVTLDVVDQTSTPSGGNQNSGGNTTSSSTGGFSLSCGSFVGTEGLIVVSMVACAIAKSKKEN